MASKKYYVVYDLADQKSIRSDTSADDVAFKTISVGGESGPVLAATPSGDFDFGGKKLTNVAEWIVKNTSYTVVSGDRILVDTHVTGITLTLPLNPVAGNWCEVMDAYGTWATNNCTVGRNGQKIEGTAENLILNVNGSRVLLVYVDSTRGWEISAEIATKTNRIEYLVLTPDDITNGYVPLTWNPLSADVVAVDIQGGVAQFPTVDFAIITGTPTKLSWSGLGMAQVCESGSTVRVMYNSLN